MLITVMFVSVFQPTMTFLFIEVVRLYTDSAHI